jgi:hypothetical protein
VALDSVILGVLGMSGILTHCTDPSIEAADFSFWANLSQRLLDNGLYYVLDVVLITPLLGLQSLVCFKRGSLRGGELDIWID